MVSFSSLGDLLRSLENRGIVTAETRQVYVDQLESVARALEVLTTEVVELRGQLLNTADLGEVGAAYRLGYRAGIRKGLKPLEEALACLKP